MLGVNRNGIVAFDLGNKNPVKRRVAEAANRDFVKSVNNPNHNFYEVTKLQDKNNPNLVVYASGSFQKLTPKEAAARICKPNADLVKVGKLGNYKADLSKIALKDLYKSKLECKTAEKAMRAREKSLITKELIKNLNKKLNVKLLTKFFG